MKRFMYVMRRAPHGTHYPQEGLEVALVGAAFEQEVSMAFIDDGVFQLKGGQDTGGLGVKNFAAAFGALGEHGVGALYVEAESLAVRGLTVGDLLTLVGEDEEGTVKSMIEVVGGEELGVIMERQDVLFNF